MTNTQAVIGRIENQSLILDLRCLDDDAGFVANLATLEAQNPWGGQSEARSRPHSAGHQYPLKRITISA